MPESREMIERHLALAERHVDEGEGHIARQVEILVELERDGHVKAADAARQLLETFETTQKSHVDDRDRLRVMLADLG